MKWHSDLIAQFEHQKINQAKEDMLITIFGNRLPEIMETAVVEYLKTPPKPGKDKWFPSVGELMPFVDAAQTEHDRGKATRLTAQMVASMSQGERDVIDADIHTWETARGGYGL